MRIAITTTASALLVVVAATGVATTTAFVPKSSFVARPTATTTSSQSRSTATPLFGYLDDLTKELYSERDEADPENETREGTKLDREKVDRAGPGDWDSYVDFEEFDGGDGQMGVAGDGKAGLEKEWKGQAQMAKSKMMSAKNAWGETTGYADKLADEGMDIQKAQRLENWHNQQAVLRQRKAHRYMTDEFDAVEETETDEDWRALGKFGVERNEDFDLDETFGAVVAGDEIEGTIEISSRINQIAISEFALKNSFMGFSDFRAAFTPDTDARDWMVEPHEGCLTGREATNFVVKFKPQNPGLSEGYLVIDTEDDKWTWKLVGSTA